MAFKDKIRDVFDILRGHHQKRILALRKKEIWLAEIKNIYDRRSEWKNYKLTNEQKKKVDEFFIKNYGKKVPYIWHRMYSNYTGNFDVRYFPEILFSTKLEEKLNPFEVAFPLGNKAFNPQRLFSGFKDLGISVPPMLFLNSSGVLWNDDGQVISYNEAKNIIWNAGEVIVKPTVETMGARGVALFNIKDGVDTISQKDIDSILKGYNENYIVQKRVKNHNSIAQLYPNSVNTFRIITFICSDGVKAAPISMRIGVGGRFVDNGGIFIGVSEDGTLNNVGFSKKGIKRFYEHPDTNIKFEGYHIEGVSAAKEAAVKLHSMLPQLGMLSWDLAYDENGDVIIIEVNTTAQSFWFPQMVTGKSIFGEYTEEMLQLIKK